MRYKIQGATCTVMWLAWYIYSRRSSAQLTHLEWFSSSSVYGLSTKLPFSEDDITDSPASLYAATKKADEMIAHTYNHIHGISVTALRFFTVYGSYGRPDMAYFSFANNIVHGKPITCFQGKGGNGLARGFTHISGVVEGVLAALETSEPSGKKSDGSKPPFRIFLPWEQNPRNRFRFRVEVRKTLGEGSKTRLHPYD